MDATINVVLLWLLFGGSHIALATKRPRAALVKRFGEWGFIGVFSAVAATTYALLIHYFAVHRFDGVASLGFSAIPAARWALFALAVVGAGVMAMALFDYPASAYALTAGQNAYEPGPIARITRHGFFSGLGLLAVAHALLATHLVETVFFGCLALFAWLGPIHQDAKLVARRGEAHRRYMAATSTLPFAAIVAGRQRLDLRAIPLPALIAAVLVPWLLRTVHASIFAAEGAYLIGFTLAGAGAASLQAWRAQRRVTSHPVGPSAAGRTAR